ncbi:zinc ABC transporter substrate-binding protein [Aliiroseovarius zhejiangensis]|uniref:High-affinity zinc uptake system protein ZnuA n=1 Tax=Aliiroseovarius zhejiangensis TaxID=1632025 RepID=A0ABQ3IRA1_9RHOB|nr:zinc ABC transporter substrate-binding protein [Aliiroseovarius zhejiangensis]GHE87623.1 zinc ABC transporter substrate-binding protein [Aliiroseovarius zhejiangensis]
MHRFTLPALFLSATPLAADPPRVVTDIAPVHSLVATVMGDLAQPELLLPQGADPHAFQMRPSQMRALSQADLVFWVGAELTPWLERALPGDGTSRTVALLDLPSTHLREASHSHDAHDDHSDHDDHEKDDSHDGHAHDPHAWLSPENGAVWLTEIAEALAHHDPENAEQYRANAADALARLQQIDTEIATLLDPVRNQGFVVFHDAYGYFTDHYGLSSLGAVRESDSAPPSAARLAEIEELLNNGRVACVFAEAAEGQDMMRDLVDGTDIGFGVLDPNGSNLPPGPNLYTDLLQGQAGAIAECLGDSAS